MKRFKTVFLQMAKGITTAVSRFPFTVICLAAAAALVCYLIAIEASPPIMEQKLIFTFGVGAFIGMVGQFALESFQKLSGAALRVYGLGLLLTAGYFAILWPAPEISGEIMIRSFVAIFAMTCAVLWIPAFRGKTDFNVVSLVHFKSFFTSLLFSAVLSAGLAAIIFSVDTLLVRVDENAYGYSMAIIWILFAPIYYLSQLPRFQSHCDDQADCADGTGGYPRVLEILVSYIGIPLITAYTLVLLAYFVKILVTTQWPSGQLGPMILIYSAVGLVLFVLASLPENRFAQLFRMLFPKVWIPIVIMQMVSVWIRINAYGFTESRYYVALFAVFSIASALFLSFRPVSKNRYIALLAAAFAIVSILPPVDAFSVSRNSQIGRMETILTAEGMLSDGVLQRKTGASDESKRELTNILEYLNRNSSLKYVAWLPEEFNIYEDMKENFGFDPYYNNQWDQNRFFYASLDTSLPLDISGYDMAVLISPYNKVGEEKEYDFTIGGTKYILSTERVSRNDVLVAVKDEGGRRLIAANLLEYAEPMADMAPEGKGAFAPDEMTHKASQGGYEMAIIFQNVSMENIGRDDFYADYTAYVLFKGLD